MGKKKKKVTANARSVGLSFLSSHHHLLAVVFFPCCSCTLPACLSRRLHIIKVVTDEAVWPRCATTSIWSTNKIVVGLKASNVDVEAKTHMFHPAAQKHNYREETKDLCRQTWVWSHFSFLCQNQRLHITKQSLLAVGEIKSNQFSLLSLCKYNDTEVATLSQCG